MYTVAVVILTLVIAWIVLYGLYRLSIYLMELHDREMERSGLPRYRIRGSSTAGSPAGSSTWLHVAASRTRVPDAQPLNTRFSDRPDDCRVPEEGQ